MCTHLHWNAKVKNRHSCETVEKENSLKHVILLKVKLDVNNWEQHLIGGCERGIVMQTNVILMTWSVTYRLSFKWPSVKNEFNTAFYEKKKNLTKNRSHKRYSFVVTIKKNLCKSISGYRPGAFKRKSTSYANWIEYLREKAINQNNQMARKSIICFSVHMKIHLILTLDHQKCNQNAWHVWKILFP